MTPSERDAPPGRVAHDSDPADETLATLIAAWLEDAGHDMSALMDAIGFKSRQKATAFLERLSNNDMTGVAHHRRELAEILGIDRARVDAAIVASRASRQREEDAAWRAAFIPHAVLLTTRRVPQPIFAAAMTGADRKMEVALPEDIPVARWPFLVARNLPHGLPGFGAVIGFVINYTPDRAVRFNRSGDPEEELAQAHRRGRTNISGLSGTLIQPQE